MEKSLNIVSKIDNINEVEKFVDEFSEENQIHSDIYGKILIATVEAVNNSIVHGNKEDVNKKVFVSFQMDKDHIKVLVEDQGKGFDYTHLPDPTKPENIENIHGRGIYLMQHLADEVEFFKEGKLVQMSFKL